MLECGRCLSSIYVIFPGSTEPWHNRYPIVQIGDAICFFKGIERLKKYSNTFANNCSRLNFTHSEPSSPGEFKKWLKKAFMPRLIRKEPQAQGLTGIR
jgi:hypothetical protein